MFDFRVDNLPPYILGEVGAKILKARQSGADIIDLSQVNPELAPPAMALDYLVGEVLREHNHRYSASKGISRLREAAAALYQRRFAVDLNPSTEVIATMGTKEALSSLLLATTEPGDTVLLPSPRYPTYAAQAFFAGAKTATVNLFDEKIDSTEPLTMESHGEGFFERLDETYKSAWPRPKMLIVNFPNNPTTVTAGKEFYKKLIDYARLNELLVVNDFSYLGIEFDDYKSFSLLSVPGAKEVAVELFSLSKGFSLAGWRIGFALGNRSAISALSRMKSYSDFGIFQPTQIAAARLLESDGEILPASSKAYQERRDILTKGLSELGWQVVQSKAGLFVWARAPEQYRTSGSLKLAESILEQAHVACLPGIGFDENSDEFVRFSLIERPKRLETAIQRLASCQLT